MKYVIGCFFSAILGAAVTLMWADPQAERAASAQPPRPTGPTLRPIAPPPGSVPVPTDPRPSDPRPTEPRPSDPRPSLPKPVDPFGTGPDPLPAEPTRIVPIAPRPAASTGPADVLPDEAAGIAVYERCNKSVANITVQIGGGEGFLGFDGATEEGGGSGVVIDKAGHVLTNFHVLEDARQVEVTLFDGESYEAHFVGADPINDLAVIRIEAPADKLFPAELGASDSLRVGQRVFAIGNPFGLERTMTTGIISSLNRTLEVRNGRSIRAIIQIDAAVNPGNSGGPLLDARGRLIGINTAIASRVGQSSGVGFAIPVNLAKRVCPQLIENGRVIRPDVGIAAVFQTDQGLRIERLIPGGPAEQAGLRGPTVTRTRRGVFVLEKTDRSTADLIVAVDGQPVKTADDLLSYVESKEIGERVTLTIIRDGHEIGLAVTLARGE
jgi:S1-C subfamily serine protease